MSAFGGRADIFGAKADIPGPLILPAVLQVANFHFVSALPLKADTCDAISNVRFGPEADVIAGWATRVIRPFADRSQVFPDLADEMAANL
jgi:hypothetical protein